MGMCWVPLCSHKGEKDHCTMFTMPKDDHSLRKWKKLIRFVFFIIIIIILPILEHFLILFIFIFCRRGDAVPNSNTRICSCHFRNGDKSAGPSILPWNERKLFMCKTPENKK